jgi:hypothetical protein
MSLTSYRAALSRTAGMEQVRMVSSAFRENLARDDVAWRESL